MKRILQTLHKLSQEVDSSEPEEWPRANKILWKLREAVNEDVLEKNSPASFFRERLSDIQFAVNMQSMDESLWSPPLTTREAYLQKSLKDLHRVIENEDVEEAMSYIRGRLDT